MNIFPRGFESSLVDLKMVEREIKFYQEGSKALLYDLKLVDRD